MHRREYLWLFGVCFFYLLLLLFCFVWTVMCSTSSSSSLNMIVCLHWHWSQYYYYYYCYYYDHLLYMSVSNIGGRFTLCGLHGRTTPNRHSSLLVMSVFGVFFFLLLFLLLLAYLNAYWYCICLGATDPYEHCILVLSLSPVQSSTFALCVGLTLWQRWCVDVPDFY